MDARLLESWLRLTADALKGTEEAQNALRALSQTPPSPEALARWLSACLPQASAGGAGSDPKEFANFVDEWWKAIGVVPRYKYLELLERYEELKGRLEETESTVRNLRELLAQRGREHEAQTVLDGWEEHTRKVLEAQSEWAQSWMEQVFGKRPEEKKK